MFAYPVFATETSILGSYEDNFVKESYIAPKALKSPHIECNCVAWAKWYLGRENESWGIPSNMQNLHSTPKSGDVVATKEGPFGHIGVILNIEGLNLYIIEANYTPCEVSTRSLSLDDLLIRGYY